MNLNNHMIEKIEKLDHLTPLRELHLANNCISKIEGVDCLVHLTVLNLNGNLIETLPAPVFKKLRELQAFLIANNRLASVSSIEPFINLMLRLYVFLLIIVCNFSQNMILLIGNQAS